MAASRDYQHRQRHRGYHEWQRRPGTYAVIPEPSSLILLVTGLLGLLAYAWRRRRD